MCSPAIYINEYKKAGMITFTKAQMASILATGIDFLVSMLLYRLISPHSPLENAHAESYKMIAGAVGTITGGICHFLISRNWVFQARDKDSFYADQPLPDRLGGQPCFEFIRTFCTDKICWHELTGC